MSTPAGVPDSLTASLPQASAAGLPMAYRSVGNEIRFAKGHGTENDFVLLLDPQGSLDLSASLVARLCDRRAGLGADGVIRVVRCDALDDSWAREASSAATWFMDYRNADGSVSQMCGNGVRVFVRYLIELGLVELGEGEDVAVGTRAGVKRVRRQGELLAVDLGPWRLTGADAVGSGRDALVRIAGTDVPLPGLSVDLGNPHVVVAVPDAADLVALDLSTAPSVDPVPPNGVNVEVVVPGPATADGGHLAMRVHERGVGETRSCGTGAAAAVLAARVWAGSSASSSPASWTVEVPGGQVRVTVAGEDLTAGPSVELAGPAVIVAEGILDPGWVAQG